MQGLYWSLRNKLEDVERALARGQNASARMAGHELGIRLSHLTTALRLLTEDTGLARTIESDDRPVQEVLTHFDEALDRLLLLLKDKQDSRAVEIVQQMFEWLDALDRSSMPAPSTDIQRTDQE